MDLDTFISRKNQLVAKYGADLGMAQGARKAEIVAAALPLAKFAKLPVEKFLSSLATLHFNRVNEERAHDETKRLRSIP